jgi:uncharacterized Zn-binding protein involved in type VI secretion
MVMATRVGDNVLDICPDPLTPGPFIQGSPNTFTNNRPQVRMMDKCVPGHSLRGSSRRFTNNKPTTRIHDPVLCGITVQSSFNTFIF